MPIVLRRRRPIQLGTIFRYKCFSRSCCIQNKSIRFRFQWNFFNTVNIGVGKSVCYFSIDNEENCDSWALWISALNIRLVHYSHGVLKEKGEKAIKRRFKPSFLLFEFGRARFQTYQFFLGRVGEQSRINPHSDNCFFDHICDHFLRLGSILVLHWSTVLSFKFSETKRRSKCSRKRRYTR